MLWYPSKYTSNSFKLGIWQIVSNIIFETLTGFILILTATEGLSAYSKDPACTNDVDNTEESKLIFSNTKNFFNDW